MDGVYREPVTGLEEALQSKDLCLFCLPLHTGHLTTSETLKYLLKEWSIFY